MAILGGCGGIGRQLTRDALAAGWAPVIFDLPASIDAHGMDGIEMHSVDASDPVDAVRAAQLLGDPLEGFVNLCGFMTDNQAMMDREILDWTEVIDGNLNAAFFAARAFVPHLAEGGAIVQIGSGLGHFARPGYGPYAVAKAGIAALTRQMALELAPGIRVNCVAPAAVDTAFLRGGTGRSDEEAPPRLEIESYAAANPMNRIAKPADITGPILFLLSDQASYVTGQVLHVNGGAFMP